MDRVEEEEGGVLDGFSQLKAVRMPASVGDGPFILCAIPISSISFIEHNVISLISFERTPGFPSTSARLECISFFDRHRQQFSCGVNVSLAFYLGTNMKESANGVLEEKLWSYIAQ